MLLSAIQILVDDIARLLHAPGQWAGPIVLVLAPEAAAPPLVRLSIAANGATETKALLAARHFVARIERFRGALAGIMPPAGAFCTPVWMEGKWVGSIFGFPEGKINDQGAAAAVEALFQVSTGLVRSALEISRLRTNLEQHDALFQKSIHDLKSFVTGFLIAGEMWSQPKNRNADVLAKLAALSYSQAKQMLAVLERLGAHPPGGPLELKLERITAQRLLRDACERTQKLLALPADWAPVIMGTPRVTLRCDPVCLGAAMAGVIAVACGFEAANKVAIAVHAVPDGVQILIEGAGEHPAKGEAPAPLRDDRFVPLDTAQRIINAHKGSIDIQWSKKRRDIFTVLIPKA